MKTTGAFILAILMITSCSIFLTGCKKKGDNSNESSSLDDVYMTAAEAILKVKDHVNKDGENKFKDGEIDKVIPEIRYRNKEFIIAYDSSMEIDGEKFWVFNEFKELENSEDNVEPEKVNWYNVNAKTGEVVAQINSDGSKNDAYVSLSD